MTANDLQVILLLGIRPNEKISKLFPLRDRKRVASCRQSLWDCRDCRNTDTWDRRDMESDHDTWRLYIWLVPIKLKQLLFLVIRRMSLPVVNKCKCFVVHPRVCHFSVLFTYLLCLKKRNWIIARFFLEYKRTNSYLFIIFGYHLLDPLFKMIILMPSLSHERDSL